MSLFLTDSAYTDSDASGVDPFDTEHGLDCLLQIGLGDHRLPFPRGGDCRRKDGVCDVASADTVIGGGQISKVCLTRHLVRDIQAPEPFSEGLVRQVKLNVEFDPAQKSRVKVLYKVGGEQDDPLITVEQVEQHRAGLIYTDVGGRSHVGNALAQEGIGFIEKDNSLLFLCCAEQITEVFRGFPHIFGFDLSIIHTDQRHRDSLGNGMGPHRFPGSRRPVQIDGQTELLWEPLSQSPCFKEERPILKIGDHVQKL